jgi:hypothetical protein
MKKQHKPFTPFLPQHDLQPEDFMSQIPLWVVVTLGKEVILKRDLVGPCETYTKGCRGILTAIDTDSDNGFAPYAIVALDPNDLGYLENFEFDDIEPVADRIKYSLDVQRGVIAF